MTLFDRVKEISKKRGYSIAETSQKAGLGQRTIYQWKNKQPSADKIQAVAKVLGVSTDYLLGNTDEPMPKQNDSAKKAVDLKEVADNEDWDEWLTSNGRPLTDHDKKVLSALFGGE